MALCEQADRRSDVRRGARPDRGATCLSLAESDLSASTHTGEIDSATQKTIETDLSNASALDRKASTAAGRKDANSVKVLVTKAIADKEAGLAVLEKATPPETAGVTFVIGLSHAFGAGPSSSNDCEKVTVTEHGGNVMPTGTLDLSGPGGFNTTNPLTFAPNGTGVFIAPSTFRLTAFGPYAESAKITVGGTTTVQTGNWSIDASNDQTTGGCPVP